MIMLVGLTVLKTETGQSSENFRSDHNEIDYNSLNCNLGIKLKCILNGLPWRRFALCEWI